MTYKEIEAALAALEEATFFLIEEYEENGGEVTESTEQQEQEIELLKDLLEHDGIDSLGRWLKSKEDKVKTLKAERDSINRQMKAEEASIEFIKSKITYCLDAIGKDKVKGNCYSFARTISHKTEVDKEILEQKYGARARHLLETILPEWVSFSLNASVKAIPSDWDDELPSEFRVTETPSCRFTKPRASKEVAYGEIG